MIDALISGRLYGGNAKPTLDLVAHAAGTAYHVTRKRLAVTAYEPA